MTVDAMPELDGAEPEPVGEKLVIGEVRLAVSDPGGPLGML